MVTIASNLNSRLTLNDGVQMPMYGLGMHMSRSGSEDQVEAAVVQALQYGYRLVDTAEFYGNEEDIGRGIRNSGVHRDDIFVSTKVWDHGYDTCKEHFHESLKKLGLDYLDLYLIHAPIGGQNIETYKAMMELKQQGLIRSVGVCNFGVHHMEGLMEANMPTPAVCQVELHPWQQKRDIVNYCRDHKIAMMGYAPLTQGKMLNDPSLLKIADKYGKSGAMVLLRWSVQHGFITIPKSSNPQRMHENKTVFDWSLKQDDMEALDKFPEWSCTWNPCVSPWMG